MIKIPRPKVPIAQRYYYNFWARLLYTWNLRIFYHPNSRNHVGCLRMRQNEIYGTPRIQERKWHYPDTHQ
jgi:hypothetical protein